VPYFYQELMTVLNDVMHRKRFWLISYFHQLILILSNYKPS